MVEATAGRIVHVEVVVHRVNAFYGSRCVPAFIEMAASGLEKAARATRSVGHHVMGNRRADPSCAGCGRWISLLVKSWYLNDGGAGWRRR